MNQKDRKHFWLLEQQLQLLDCLIIRALKESNLEQFECHSYAAFIQYQKVRKMFVDYIADLDEK